jgi:single-strand DNA-binding protein
VSALAASNVNVVVITGNLTRDPELRHTGGGTAICELRVAVNSRRKDGQSGQWVDKPNYFDVVVWGAQGENCANYLAKGRPVAVEGRLDWREWEAKDGSGKRQAVQIVANSVQFLGSRDGSGGQPGGNGGGFSPPASDVPADNTDFEPAPAGGGGGGAEDDIPF